MKKENKVGEDMIVLGKDCIYNNKMDERDGLNGNVLLVGPSGSGKTVSHVIPNIYKNSGSFIIMDYKGNLYDKFYGYFKSKEYKIMKLDFTNLQDSVHYNPMHYIKDEQDMVKIADFIVRSGNGKEGAYDPFWNLSASLLLRALMSIVWHEKPEKERNLKSVEEYLNKITVVADVRGNIRNCEMDDFVDYLKEKGKKYSGIQDYLSVRNTAPDTLKSILISLKTALAKFTSKEVMEILAYDELEMEKIGERETVLFINASDSDSSLDPIITLLYTQLFNELMMAADKHKENDCRLPVATHFILDDFASGCPVPNFDRIIANIRSRNITAMLMIQSLQQLYSLYEDKGKVIEENCDNRVFFSTLSVDTIKNASQLSNYPADKIRKMKVDDLLVIRRGQEPKMTTRYNTFDDPEYKEIMCESKEKIQNTKNTKRR